MHSKRSFGFAVIWGQGRVAWSPLLQGDVIASPLSPCGRARVWYIIGVGWGITGSERFALLPIYQPPPISSLACVDDAAAAALRDGTCCGASPQFGMVALPPPLARMFPKYGLGQHCHFLPLLPPSSSRMTLFSHAMSAQSSMGGMLDNPPPSRISICTTP